eukprot:CAMPEP_0172600248 /NCGR_PEP_ID=MMETSP1068-20121228/20392_1 /TAXON_ID=35684 /ORGANISM="Pseudopedinella elastica, Strain CCMP716" /LENGTH=482 /DNA_ID=CAMNT_0013400811 /DNA_START=150 /DNA_END=1598 /DNA_ORIENTATION=+
MHDSGDRFKIGDVFQHSKYGPLSFPCEIKKAPMKPMLAQQRAGQGLPRNETCSTLDPARGILKTMRALRASPNPRKKYRFGPPSPKRINDELGGTWPSQCVYNRNCRTIDCENPPNSRFDPWAAVSNVVHSSSDTSERRYDASKKEAEDILGSLPRPSKASKHQCAIFTVVRNESTFLPIWARYYARHFDPRDMVILDHSSSDNSTDKARLPAGVTVRVLRGDASFFPHYFLVQQVQIHQQLLLKAGFKCVVFSEVDEILVANASRYARGLGQYLEHFARDDSLIYARSTGYRVSHELNGSRSEPKIDWHKDIFAQRSYWAASPNYNKPYVTKVPIQYIPGFHRGRPFEDFLEPPKGKHRRLTSALLEAANETALAARAAPTLPRVAIKLGPAIPIVGSDLALVHLAGADFDYCMQREKRKSDKAAQAMHAEERKQFLGMHFVRFDTWVKEKRACTTLMETTEPVKKVPEEFRSSSVFPFQL